MTAPGPGADEFAALLGIDVARRIPQLRPHQRTGALEVDRVDLDHRHRARRLVVDGERGKQRGFDAEMGAAVHA